MSVEETGVCEPASTLIRRLGGPTEVARGIRVYSITTDGDRRTRGVNSSTVCRWALKIDRGGTDGVIPVKYWPALIKLGRERGVEVTIYDLSPRVAAALSSASTSTISGEVA